MNKLIKAANKASSKIVLASVALMGAASAHAEGVDISAAVTSATTDIKVAGGLIVGVVVAVAAFSWIRRVIK